MVNNTDFIVIGAGTSGLKAALHLAKDHSVALIEPDVLGGTCLNKGCIPTKAMLQSAHLFEQAKDLTEFGISTGKVSADMKKIMQRVKGIIKEGQDHIKKGVKKKNLTVYKGSASFVDKNTIRVGSQRISADHIIIATGAKNFVPPIKGLEKITYINNENIYNLAKIPKSVVMVGGGYISMELATFFCELGSKVTVLERHHHILGMLDNDISELLAKYYTDKGVDLQLNANILEIRKGKGYKEVMINHLNDPASKPISIKGEEIVMAVGRMPNTKDLKLENADVKTTDRGAIIVDEYLQTSNKDIFAMGDCTNLPMFAHAAKREEQVLMNNLFHSKRKKVDMHLCPWAVFTHPVVSGVGLSEKQAREQCKDVGILKAPFTQNGRARIIGDARGFVKVTYNKKTKNILGCVIMGPNADDLIHEFAILMNTEHPSIDILRKTIHVHPTISEVMENLKEVKE